MQIKSWNFRWGAPEKNKILIFEKTGSDDLIKMIFKDTPVTVYGTDMKLIYISWPILFKCFKNFFIFNWYKSLVNSKKIKSIVKQFGLIYLFSLIDQIKPKVIVTYVDNNRLFSILSKEYTKAQFFAIQNGTRTKKELLNTKFELTNLFCFGNYEVDTYAKFNHRVENFIPVGSLRSDYFINCISKSKNIFYDISLISGINEYELKKPKNKQYYYPIDLLLSKYVKDNNIKVAILKRGADIEDKYFKSCYGDSAILIDRDDSKWSTYQGMYNSEVIITFFSTCGREALKWGKKVLFCDFTDSDLYNYMDEGIWLLKENNYLAFKKRMDLMMNMNKDEYHNEVKKYANYLMEKNDGIPSYEIIQETLNNYV